MVRDEQEYVKSEREGEWGEKESEESVACASLEAPRESFLF